MMSTEEDPGVYIRGEGEEASFGFVPRKTMKAPRRACSPRKRKICTLARALSNASAVGGACMQMGFYVSAHTRPSVRARPLSLDRVRAHGGRRKEGRRKRGRAS